MEAIRKMEPAWQKVSSSKFRLSSRKIIQRWCGGQYQLTPQYAELGLAADRLSISYSLKGKLKYNTYLVWTEKGRDFIMDLVKYGR